jgi:hypothetical protein
MSRIPAAHARIPSVGIAACCAAAALALALCVSAAGAPASGQARTTLTADAEAPALGRDHARLAALGLDLATLERGHDAALLWRAVRELVLSGKVSEATQQRILRRVWLVDPDIARGSQVDSATH